MIKVKHDEWGGKRSGAGRPALTEGEKTRSITITLPERDIKFLKRAGGGNRSEGVRRIIEALRSYFPTHEALLVLLEALEKESDVLA